MAMLPYSCLSFHLLSGCYISDGTKLRCLGRRQVKLKLEPIRLQCQIGNLGSMQTGMPFCHCQDIMSAFETQQEEPFVRTDNFQRRRAILGGFVSSLSLHFFSSPAHSLPTDFAGNPISTSSTVLPTAAQVDEINAYSYLYPVGASNELPTFRWVESRKPERYSSAAPLSPNARQRIVSERLDIKNNLVISVSVGPPNTTFLKSSEPDSWDAKDVARSVLADKIPARMTTGQRVAEVSILDAKTDEKDGTRYWYYEYVVQKSPSLQERGIDVVRHSVAVTAEREGYLYSLNASTSGDKWSYFSPLFRQSVLSFRLDSPTTEYVPPYQDPWRFW